MQITIKNLSKIILKYTLLLVVVFSVVFPFTVVRAEGCASMTINYFPNGIRPPTPYTSNTTIKVSSSDELSINYKLQGCTSSIGSTGFKVAVEVNGNSTVIDQGSAGDRDVDKTLEVPVANGTYKYSLIVTGIGRGTVDSKAIDIAYVVVAPPPPSNTNTKPPANVNTQDPKDTNTASVPAFDVKLPQIKDSFNGKSISEVSLQIIRILFLLIVIAAVIVIVIAGFRMVVSGSNPQELTKAKKAIIWAIIGLIVALMSYSIVEIVSRIF